MLRHLSVFRDIQESERHLNIPDQWNGEKEKHEVEISFECFMSTQRKAMSSSRFFLCLSRVMMMILFVSQYLVYHLNY